MDHLYGNSVKGASNGHKFIYGSIQSAFVAWNAQPMVAFELPGNSVTVDSLNQG